MIGCNLGTEYTSHSVSTNDSSHGCLGFFKIDSMSWNGCATILGTWVAAIFNVGSSKGTICGSTRMDRGCDTSGAPPTPSPKNHQGHHLAKQCCSPMGLPSLRLPASWNYLTLQVASAAADVASWADVVLGMAWVLPWPWWPQAVAKNHCWTNQGRHHLQTEDQEPWS